MTAVLVLPSIHPPYTEACLAGMHPEVRAATMVVDNTTVNRGVAGSWNLGARRVLDEGHDWLVSLSAATRFGPSGGRDFLALLDENTAAWVVESAAPVGWHLIGWSRHVLETVGLFDENHWPAYGEDADMARRIYLAAGGEFHGVWLNRPVDAWIAMQNHGMQLAGVEVDHERTWRYHVAKWGGLSGHETYTAPFDIAGRPLSWWPTPPHRRSIIDRRRWAERR